MPRMTSSTKTPCQVREPKNRDDRPRPRSRKRTTISRTMPTSPAQAMISLAHS